MSHFACCSHAFSQNFPESTTSHPPELGVSVVLFTAIERLSSITRSTGSGTTVKANQKPSSLYVPLSKLFTFMNLLFVGTCVCVYAHVCPGAQACACGGQRSTSDVASIVPHLLKAAPFFNGPQASVMCLTHQCLGRVQSLHNIIIKKE